MLVDPEPVRADKELRIVRLDQGVVVLETALAEAFFREDASSIGVGSYDSLAGHTTAATIETADIEALNRTMRARTPHTAWSAITAIHLPWLAAIDPELDLIEAEDDQWTASSGEEVVGAALAATVQPGRGVSVATKMLHLKRPRLFPILDELVAQMLGGGISADATPTVKAQQALRLVLHLRTQGRASLDVLRSLQEDLARKGIERPLVRILDAILWSAHPAVNAYGPRRLLECRTSHSRGIA